MGGKRRTFLLNSANDNKCFDLTATDVSVCKIRHASTLFWGLGCCRHVLNSSLVSDPKLLSLMLHIPLQCPFLKHPFSAVVKMREKCGRGYGSNTGLSLHWVDVLVGESRLICRQVMLCKYSM